MEWTISVCARARRLPESHPGEFAQELTPDEPVVCSGHGVERGVQPHLLGDSRQRFGSLECKVGGSSADPVVIHAALFHFRAFPVILKKALDALPNRRCRLHIQMT